MKITINRQLKDLVYPLTDEEFQLLEQSILSEGVRDPLVIWANGKNYLIDGHHRYTIITKHKIKQYPTKTLSFDNKHQVINWILENQLGRRNCTPEGLAYLRGLRYRNEKNNHGGDRASAQNEHLKTADRLAKQLNTSQATIRRDETFADAVDKLISVFTTPVKRQEIKNRILNRQYELTKKDIVELSEMSEKDIKSVLEEEKEFSELKLNNHKKEKSARLKQASRLSLPEDIQLYVGDAVELSQRHIKPNSIPCIITQPPADKSVECFEELGKIAERVLESSGFCCFFVETKYLSDAIKIMGEYLEYYWQVVILNNDQAYSSGTGFNEIYKSLLIFQKPPHKKLNENCDDLIIGSNGEKSPHKWQQEEMGLYKIVESCSVPHSVVFDPFAGSGTTAVVCKKLNRHFFGTDVDEQKIKEAKIRVKNVSHSEPANINTCKNTPKINIQIYHGDCRKIIPQYRLFEKADIIITDPPYNLGCKYDGYRDNMPRKEYVEMLRIFKDFPCAIVHYPEQTVSVVHEAIGKEPTEVVSWIYRTNTPKNFRLISFYNCSPDFSKVGQEYDCPYDARIQNLLLNGKEKQLTDWWDINIVKNVAREKTEHPCQLPVELCQRLIAILSEPGESILDPFMGVGSMAVACKRMERHFFGVEVSHRYVEIARKRVKTV